MHPSHSMAQREPYASGGRCIYCCEPFPKLTKEHIVPEALSGTWCILGACNDCAAQSNEEYEQLVLQSDMVRTMRDFLALKRKRKNKKKPIEMPPLFKHGTAGQTTVAKTDYLPKPDDNFYPRLFMMIALEPAMRLSPPDTILAQRPFRLWMRNVQGRKPGPVVVTDPATVANAYTSPTELILSADVAMANRRVSIRQRFPALKFMRMLAKIAYCFAVAEHGIDRYSGSEIQQLVRGERDDYYNFVGGSVNGEFLSHTRLHHLEFRRRGDLMTVLVHLFSSYHAPPYEVVIGQAS